MLWRLGASAGVRLAAAAGVLVACTSVDSPVTTQATTPTTSLPTREQIMADGQVTDEERELARRAVFDCLVEAGADTTFELFDVDGVVRRDFPEAYERCQGEYVGLARRNEVSESVFDLGLLGIVECVEDRTGRDFGPKTIDEIGRLTPESQRTVTRAIQAEPMVFDHCEREIRGNAVETVVHADVTGYRLDEGDPKRVLFHLADCGYVSGARLIEENADEVIVQIMTSTPTMGPCWILHPVRLKNPLGDRSVINEATGRSISLES